MTTGGYELLEPPRPRQQLVHIHAGAEELGRVYAADLLAQCVDGLRRAGAGDARAAAPRSPGAHGRARRTPTTKPTCVPTPVAPLDLAEVVQDDRPARRPPTAIFTNGAGNFAGWLHRFHPLRGPAPRRPHAARADLGRDGLRRAGRRSPRALLQPAAHGHQHRRRRRLPDDRPGARDGDRARRRPRRRQAGQRSSSTTAPTARSACTRSASTRAASRGTDLGNPDFAALARAYGWRASERVDDDGGVRAGAACRARAPTGPR